MADLSLDPKTTAVLFMDFQAGIVPRLGDRAADLVARVGTALTAARASGALVAYVRVAFRPGYPEINERNAGFGALKKSGMAMFIDAPETQIIEGLAPLATEPVIVKHRVGAFGSTHLAAVLRGYGADTLVLFGVSTSGVVLSTLRHAADDDYRIVVAEDGCADPDPEVHRVLMEKVFSRQATVTSTADIVAALGRAKGLRRATGEGHDPAFERRRVQVGVFSPQARRSICSAVSTRSSVIAMRSAGVILRGERAPHRDLAGVREGGHVHASAARGQSVP